MELSSPRFKAFAVSVGFSFWFFIITSALSIFSIEIFLIFVISIFVLMQILAVKLSQILDYFAIFNTKVFLGLLFVTVISTYGVIFRILRIDLLRLKKQKNSYWLTMEKLEDQRVLKQY